MSRGTRSFDIINTRRGIKDNEKKIEEALLEMRLTKRNIKRYCNDDDDDGG